jgi:hypothetical protein
VLQQGKALTTEVIAFAEPVYTTIKELYDPSIPAQSKAILFAKERLEKNRAPWVAMQATYNSIHNWNHQYSSEIASSTKYLLESTPFITNLAAENDLSKIFGDNLPKLDEYIRKAERIKSNIELAENIPVAILSVPSLRKDIEEFSQLTNDVLSLLYSQLIAEEQAIERSLPSKDYPWGKNISLTSRLKMASETLKNRKIKTNQILSNLPVFLSTINESLQTLTIYREEKEFLLSQLSPSKKPKKNS